MQMVFDKESFHMPAFCSKMALDIRSEFESTSAFYSKIPRDLRFESSSTKEKESIHVIETLLGCESFESTDASIINYHRELHSAMEFIS